MLAPLHKPKVKKAVLQSHTTLHTVYYVTMGLTEHGMLSLLCWALAGITVCIGVVYRDHAHEERETTET